MKNLSPLNYIPVCVCLCVSVCVCVWEREEDINWVTEYIEIYISALSLSLFPLLFQSRTHSWIPSCPAD